MSRGPDAASLLRRAIEVDARRGGCALTVGQCHSERWASATFVGARHVLMLEGADDAALSCWIAAIAELDLPVRHHLVADIAVTGIDRASGRATLRIEALTVET